MRLDEVNVDDYGPLDVELEFDDGVEVIYGPNESGKTLLVDALLLMLTGENDDDRVGQDPIGYVRVHEGDGTHRLDDGETILDRLEARHGISLDAREFRNTFVVRSADSQLSKEDDYYDRATAVVAESLVDDIDRVREAIHDAGRITPTGILIDRGTETRTKRHRRTARDINGEIREFIDDAREAGIPLLEAQLFETEQRVAERSEELERLRAAKRRQEFEAQSANRDDLESTLVHLEELPDENDLNELADDIDSVLESADRSEALDARRTDSQNLVRLAVGATAIALVGVLGVGVLALSSIGPSLVGFAVVVLLAVIVTAIPGGLALYFWRKREAAQEELSEMRSDRTAALQQGRELGIDADDLSELSTSVAELQRRRSELHQRATELHGELKGVLGLSSTTLAETLEQASEELEARGSDLDGAIDVDYTEGAFEEAQSELSELQEGRDDIEVELDGARDEMQSFGDVIADIPFSEYGLESPRTDIETLEGLETLADKLDELVETIEVDADNARAANDILEELKEHEQSRVGELFFGAESKVSEYFSRTTDGRYESVRYDEGANELRVRMANETELKPSQLSQSTFDQLYFAVRLAFAQELLDEATGFILLDDAFLAADADRLARQVDILADLASDGWQILYFTAQEFARDRLTEGAGATVHPIGPLE